MIDPSLAALGEEGAASLFSQSKTAKVGRRGEFIFDRCFEGGSQEEIYKTVGLPLVQAVLRGTNATIFAYGQTGTGKVPALELELAICSARAHVLGSCFCDS